MAVKRIVCDGICENCEAAGLLDVSDDDDEEELFQLYCQPKNAGNEVVVEKVGQAS